MKHMLKATAVMLAIIMISMSSCSEQPSESPTPTPTPEPTISASPTPTTSPEPLDNVDSDSLLHKVELKKELQKELNIFMSAFVEESFVMYDSENIDGMELLRFAVARVYRETPEEFKEAEKTPENLPDLKFVVSKEAVDAILLKYFNITDFSHGVNSPDYYFEDGLYYVRQPEEIDKNRFASVLNIWGDLDEINLVCNVLDCTLNFEAEGDRSVIYEASFAEFYQEEITINVMGACNFTLVENDNGQQGFFITRLDIFPTRP